MSEGSGSEDFSRQQQTALDFDDNTQKTLHWNCMQNSGIKAQKVKNNYIREHTIKSEETRITASVGTANIAGPNSQWDSTEQC